MKLGNKIVFIGSWILIGFAAVIAGSHAFNYQAGADIQLSHNTIKYNETYSLTNVEDGIQTNFICTLVYSNGHQHLGFDCKEK